MKHIKSERLKKLEAELTDVEQWLKLGLVPKKDMEKHKEEIRQIKEKIKEEKDRLQFLKESGDAEEFIAPKRQTSQRGAFNDMPTIPDIEVGETQGGGYGDTGFDVESEYETSDTFSQEVTEEEEPSTKADKEEKEEEEEEEEEDSFFSNRNRWRREGIVDPDADQW